jgi:hypothetical protein
MVSSVNIPMGGIWGITNGCMSLVDNAYTDVNRNQNSFCIIHIDTLTRQAVPEMIVFSDGAAVVGGKRYTRIANG